MTTPPEKPKSTPRRLQLRTLVKLTLLAMVILVLIPALQILVPAVAYRDDLIALLNTSDDCKAPCFMGITPGKSTLEDVQNHPLVTGIVFNTEQLAVIEWKHQKPEIVSWAIHLQYSNEVIVSAIELQTTLPFTSAMLLFGYSPDMSSDTRYTLRPETEEGVVFITAQPERAFYSGYSHASIFDLLDDTVDLWFADGV
jgi:hypothetical protein